MGNFIDLTGQKFNKLTVLKRAENSPSGSTRWKCLCDCGNISVVLATELKKGGTKSCGCLRLQTPKNFVDLTGKTFGKLRVISREKNHKHWNSRWKCLCDCGNIIVAYSGSLRRGLTTSCGCSWIEAISTHERSKTVEYRAWAGMLQRCYNPKTNNFKNYGGRGIIVHEEWINDFMSFFKYIGPKPSKIHSVERINNNGNYEPGNVRWATPKEQANNMRSNHVVTFREKTMTVTQWAEKLGINRSTLDNRIKHGWPIEKAFTEPINH